MSPMVARFLTKLAYEIGIVIASIVIKEALTSLTRLHAPPVAGRTEPDNRNRQKKEIG